MTVKTMVSTEELQPGDLVAHEDVPEHIATGHVVGIENSGNLSVVWSGMAGSSTSIPSERLRLIERPEAYAVVEFEGLQARIPEEITIDAYTFVVIGGVASVSDDVDIYQTAPRYRVVSFRLGREDSRDPVSE